jgi:hypothetical protein
MYFYPSKSQKPVHHFSKKLVFACLLCCFSTFTYAQNQAPDNLNLVPLRTWLKQNWYDSDFSDLGYNGARTQMYGFVDANNNLLTCVYSGFQQASGFVTFPNPINAEHIIPQSFYGSASPMRSDIHNLRGTHGSVNSARGNKPFDDATGNITYYGVDNNGDYLSTGTTPNNVNEFSKGDSDSFEPRESMKGDVARQVFYFYTMYPTQAGSIDGVADINVLYQWHLDDPVDAAEIERNNRINSVQGNLNPYISYPEYVYKAWLFVEVLGCTDENAFNFDSSANTDDGSCIPVITGCTNELAVNYDAQANTDDGSCLFEVLGCTYEAALNYVSNATVDDGSCLFPTIGVLGCTYPEASNYNSNADSDDGSCLFDLVSSCPEDVNSDGLVDVTDFLQLLGAFGTSCE